MRRRPAIALATLALVALLGLALGDRPAADVPNGQNPATTVLATRISDGDSFHARDDTGRELRVRIVGIDAPERDQPHGSKARDALRDAIGNREVRIDVRDTDRHGRQVARVELDTAAGQRVDIGLKQIEQGYAWWYRRGQLNSAEQRQYESAQADARKARRGLWQQPDPTPPWEFRRASR